MIGRSVAVREARSAGVRVPACGVPMAERGKRMNRKQRSVYEDGDAIWGLIGLLVGGLLAASILFALVSPVVGLVLMWGVPLLVGLGALALAAFAATRGDKERRSRTGLVRGIKGEREGERESKARTGLEATTAAAATAFPLERAGTVRVAAGMTGE